jgi:hypothetical protein
MGSLRFVSVLALSATAAAFALPSAAAQLSHITWSVTGGSFACTDGGSGTCTDFSTGPITGGVTSGGAPTLLTFVGGKLNFSLTGPAGSLVPIPSDLSLFALAYFPAASPSLIQVDLAYGYPYLSNFLSWGLPLLTAPYSPPRSNRATLFLGPFTHSGGGGPFGGGFFSAYAASRAMGGSSTVLLQHQFAVGQEVRTVIPSVPTPTPTPTLTPTPSATATPTPTPTATPTPTVPPSGRITICHHNESAAGTVTIEVGAAALDAHVGHGDSLGPCP